MFRFVLILCVTLDRAAVHAHLADNGAAHMFMRRRYNRTGYTLLPLHPARDHGGIYHLSILALIDRFRLRGVEYDRDRAHTLVQ
jgi:hypothetical protein